MESSFSYLKKIGPLQGTKPQFNYRTRDELGQSREHRTLANRPLPNSKNPHFQNKGKYTTFVVKMSFICMRMKNHFDIKARALNFVLIQRPGKTRKWRIVCLGPVHPGLTSQGDGFVPRELLAAKGLLIVKLTISGQ